MTAIEAFLEHEDPFLEMTPLFKIPSFAPEKKDNDVNPNESTSRYLLKMLGKPVLSQFDRKKTDKSGAPPLMTGSLQLKHFWSTRTHSLK
jgi:hypothetical protein